MTLIAPVYSIRRLSGHVQVFGRRNAETIDALGRPASEKRQGTKSWGVGAPMVRSDFDGPTSS
jgi:hypothetical protein